MSILIVDDHPLTCRGLAALLQGAGPGPVHCVHSAAEALARLEQGPPPDWVFLDMNLPDDPQRMLFTRLSAPPWPARTVLLSAEVPQALVHAGLGAGMRGFIPKSAEPERVLEGFAAIRAGQVWLPPGLAEALAARAPDTAGGRGLSPRLREVQARVLRGASNKAIAREFGISEHTVKEYMSSILAFHGVSNRLELVLRLGAG